LQATKIFGIDFYVQRQISPNALEHVKFEIAPCCVVEDEAGKEGEAGNLIWFPMQPDVASRRRKQQQAQSQV